MVGHLPHGPRPAYRISEHGNCEGVPGYDRRIVVLEPVLVPGQVPLDRYRVVEALAQVAAMQEKAR